MSKDDLNQFTRYSGYASYNQKYAHQDNLNMIARRNPLEFYTNHNIEPPRTLHGDPVKILQQDYRTTTEQPKESINLHHQIHHFSTEINKICTFANEFINDKKQPTKITVNHKPEAQAPKDADYEAFKEFISKNQKNGDQSELDKEFQEFLEYKHSKGQANHKESMDTSIVPPQKSDRQIYAGYQPSNTANPQRKSVRELYQRGNKNVLCVDEIKLTGNKQSSTVQIQSLTTSPQPTLTQLQQHPDLEIQKAVQALLKAQHK